LSSKTAAGLARRITPSSGWRWKLGLAAVTEADAGAAGRGAGAALTEGPATST